MHPANNAILWSKFVSMERQRYTLISIRRKEVTLLYLTIGLFIVFFLGFIIGGLLMKAKQEDKNKLLE